MRNLLLCKPIFYTLLILSLLKCSDEEAVVEPVIIIGEPSKALASHTYFVISADLESPGSEAIVAHGFVYSPAPNPTLENAVVIDYGVYDPTFSFSVDLGIDLLPSTTYYVAAFVKTEDEKIHYSETVRFTSLPGTWKQLADFPGPHRISSVTFTAGGYAYLLGGVDLENNAFTDVWRYDPATDAWSQKADFPASINAGIAAAFVIDDITYITSTSGFWQYDLSDDNWTKIGAGSTQTNVIAFSANGKGYTGSGFFNGYFMEYEPASNKWTQMREYPGEAMFQSYSTSAGGKGYAGYGQDWPGKSYVNEFYEYTPSTNEWAKKSSFLQFNDLRKGMICFSVSNKVYMGMGRNINDFDFAHLFEYAPLTGWREVSSLPGSQRSNAVGFSVGGKGFVGLGLKYYNGGLVDKLKDVWQFTP